MALEVAEVLRILTVAMRESSEWQMMNSLPTGFVGTCHPDVPASYCEFLKAADGGTYGSVTLFSAASVNGNQFYADSAPGAPIQLGREEWFCCGVINDEPIFIKKLDGSVWCFPDSGVEWWMSSRFEKLSESFPDFFADYVIGSGYARISALGNEDQWCELLRRAGLI